VVALTDYIKIDWKGEVQERKTDIIFFGTTANANEGSTGERLCVGSSQALF
jgi:hypothetical protein